MSNQLKSEGEQLDAILAELQRDNQVKEVSGWRTGFDNLDRALDGILPGLYLLVGLAGCGKTTFAKQVLDQIVLNNFVVGIFFTFAESKNELRIKTLSRLSEIENREIRRGSAYLLHWYGVPRLQSNDAGQLPASWDKLQRMAAEAKGWLDRVYLFECDRGTAIEEIERHVQAVLAAQQTDRAVVVVDDCQRLGKAEQTGIERINSVAETLQAMARKLHLPIFAVASSAEAPTAWADQILSPDVIIEANDDRAHEPKLGEQKRAVKLSIVKNRGGERGALAFEFNPAFAKFVEP